MTHQELVDNIRKNLSTNPLIDGWLIHDYCGRNRAILDLFGLPRETCFSRRFFYFIPRKGPPVAFVHTVDEHLAEYFPGILERYNSWEELSGQLFTHLEGKGTLAMEDWYSELLPSQSILDAGTKKWLEENGKSITTSWPLVEAYIGKFRASQKELFKAASLILDKAFLSAWKLIKERLSAQQSISEFELQEYILRIIRGEGGTCSGKPIVAAGKHSAVPHHESTKTPIQKDEIVLIDAWCKKDDISAPYADFTQVAFTGKNPPIIIQNAFQIVQRAQSQALTFIETCYKNGCSITGVEVDNACRHVIDASSFHGCFPHRTGHNIYLDVHGPGANLDNFETRDTRHLIENGCYSVEPGIYLQGEFGIRLECSFLMENNKTISVFNKAPVKLACIEE